MIKDESIKHQSDSDVEGTIYSANCSLRSVFENESSGRGCCQQVLGGGISSAHIGQSLPVVGREGAIDRERGAGRERKREGGTNPSTIYHVCSISLPVRI